MSFNRIAAIGGFITVALLILNGALLGSQPTLDDPIEDVVRYIGDDLTMHRLAMAFGILSLPFIIVFMAGIVSKLRDGDRELNEAWGIAALAGAILTGATAAIGDTFAVMLFLRGGDGLDDSTVRVIYDGVAVAYGSMGISIAALTGSVAVATIKRKFWPDWYGWLSALAAVIGFISVGGIFLTSFAGLLLGFAPFVALLVWTLATSVLMYREN